MTQKQTKNNIMNSEFEIIEIKAFWLKIKNLILFIHDVAFASFTRTKNCVHLLSLSIDYKWNCLSNGEPFSECLKKVDDAFITYPENLFFVTTLIWFPWNWIISLRRWVFCLLQRDEFFG